MAKRRKKNEEEGGEGGAWEIALADLMTVLMVFFLVMWLISIVDPSDRQSFVDSLVGKGGSEKISVSESSSASDQIVPIEELKPPVSPEEISDSMSGMNPKDIDIEETDEYTKITLHSDSFFESGRANITDKTREELEKLGETLAGRGQPITVTGYTDSLPISNLQFPSNWELSAARAATIARTFIYMGVNKDLVTIVGKGDNDPVASNESAYGRSLNRRVVIQVDKDQTSGKD
ncbi:flagellar motor protein MotB [Thiomicrospira sp. WB1]|uniref:OmpA/MotB family protein n=1 Tax=Thiomicrospira sp. WB1 TaxID=1685380 RepID=UPI0007470E4B|nr:flagellar motor protein MotB [Thiomicrospira sp. WB1]KUJ72605.1 cell envelope biogenesis protein OmpA [Thiomicrospira sp. WB1]